MKPAYQTTLWLPRLLLGALLTVLLFGACAAVRFTRKDRRANSLDIRYTIRRKGLLLLFFPEYDTVAVTFAYRKRPVPVPAACPDARQPATIARIRARAAAEPQWLAEVRCPARRSTLYLFRVPPAGAPEFHQIGPARLGIYTTLIPLANGTKVYVPDSNEQGVVFDWETHLSQPVAFPALPAAVRVQGGYQRYAYLLSPDGQWLGRAYAPDTLRPGPPASQGRRDALVLDQYHLADGRVQRTVLPGVRVAPAQLPAGLRWRRAGEEWTLEYVP